MPIETDGADDPLPLSLSQWIIERIEPLQHADEIIQKAKIQIWWMELSTREIFILNKLMSGSLRIGVSDALVYRAMSEAFGLPRHTLAARLLGHWKPSVEFFNKVVLSIEKDSLNPDINSKESNEALPVPFCLAAPLDASVESLGSIEDWQIEWKWDGIRIQVVKVGDQVELWSRGEERTTDAFPDLVDLFLKVPCDFILDGELLAGSTSKIKTFNDLQKRLNRKKVSSSFIQENPVVFLAYDLLREGGTFFTQKPLSWRRQSLEKFVERFKSNHFGISTLILVPNWLAAQELQLRSRIQRAEGLMLKRRDAPYFSGRKRGVWYKWKIDPFTLDVILTAAQPGSGRRASLYTDYTFSIWKGEVLVPIAKAYSGLTDQEIHEVDRWIRKNTLERFGPVRMVSPVRVFEIGFEGISKSSRHKSGFAVRFPRILRERNDKPAAEADRVETAQNLFDSFQTGDTEHE